MKFTKTLLAVSVAVAAASANAAWVNPAQNVNGLIGIDARAPVLGVVNLSDITVGSKEIDLGSGVILPSQTGTTQGDKLDVFRYVSKTSSTTIFELQSLDGKSLGLYSLNGGTLQPYTGGQVNLGQDYTLQKGGQIQLTTTGGIVSGEEIKVANSEHVLYGYQGTTITGSQTTTGTIVDPNGIPTPISSVDFTSPQRTDTSKYVQTGIIGNTGPKDAEGHALDVSKNMYGVSAKDANNITVLTGNGIALGDLSNGGKLLDNGTVLKDSTVSYQQNAVEKTRLYSIDGKQVIEVYNDNAGSSFETKYYTVNGNTLVKYEGTTPVAGSHSKTGTSTYQEGTFKDSISQSTVTSKNVTYGESVVTSSKAVLQAGVTTPNGSTDVVNNADLSTLASNQITKSQSAVLGIIAQQDGENVYGLEVKKTNEGPDIKTTSAKTTITADYVDSGDFRVNGVSIVDNIKTEVGEAVTVASATIDKKVAEVDSRLTQFNATADRLNSRINDIKETAYSGVAIALAAQQQVPNIGAGQVAVFGGAGHYEGETAGALGLVGVLADGRTSLSGALGVGGSGDVGGRVGVAYVFGGK